MDWVVELHSSYKGAQHTAQRRVRRDGGGAFHNVPFEFDLQTVNLENGFQWRVVRDSEDIENPIS